MKAMMWPVFMGVPTIHPSGNRRLIPPSLYLKATLK
jgi:hypothetical protein